MKTLLQAIDIHKYFGKQHVLKGINLDVYEGETVVIIGPSGSGKSTLLRCLNLLIKPDRGRIIFDGVDITSGGVDINKVRQEIGFVFQSYNLFAHLTAIENVVLGLVKVKKMSREEARRVAAEALLSVGITEDLWSKYPAQLSGGQQQRVAIARAIAMNPRLLLLDEPTSALDPELTVEVLNVLEKLSEKRMTMIIVTHQLGFAMRAADEVVFMEDGKIVEKGPPEKILLNPEKERTREFVSRLMELYRMERMRRQ
ncbi:amino acid ABC transporter ATP-binding protein [Ignisphaera sp. 4213-co]|uniref:Amino acid ABC transporter ATP-binding protein n=1 Tax=Ignisphaera cupida TaxID=3050454 RepID=A0ABD4Z6A5_9CREN|nr:amino acid ABC transporter ATP-binding protein [Ignisphaera sp. 4213-co]MDK6028846.1 amino acid ABC transporter ATP-binding protein [Ignisphaera sp. 4213-co]